jgi:hypothetical protein
MSAFMIERERKRDSMDHLGVAEEVPSVRSHWQTSAESKWGATAVWIHGDGQFALLQPCSDQLTVTLCGSLVDAARLKKDTCCGRCSKSRHIITDLAE